MTALVADGSYAGWGWGATMIDTEMVIFSADGDSSSAETYYSTKHDTPSSDPSQQACYTTTITQQDDGYTKFETTRPLECGTSNSYVVSLDTKLSLITAWNPNNP